MLRPAQPRAAHRARRGSLSKFQPCLPEALEARMLRDRLYDVEEAQRFVQAHQVVSVEQGGGD
jgi:ATP-dependent helicase Lhr and Lhr-like helicase